MRKLHTRLAACSAAALLATLLIPAPARAQGSADAALASYTLTMPSIRKLATAYEHINDALENNPALVSRLERDAGVSSAEELIGRFEQEPELKQSIASAGISARDLVLTQFALFTAGLNDYAVRSGGSAPAGVAASNLKLYEQNRTEIDQITAKLRTLRSWQAEQGDDESGDSGSDEYQ